MNDKPIHEMTFEEYCLFQLPTAQHFAPGQPESFYRRQALRNFANIQNIKRNRATANDALNCTKRRCHPPELSGKTP